MDGSPFKHRFAPARVLWPALLSVVWLGAGPAQPDPPRAPSPADAALVLKAVSAERLDRDVRRLAGFGTRHTLSETESDTRGIGAARRWIRRELEAAAAASGLPPERRLQVSFDRHTLAPDGRRIPREVEIVNVLAVLPGTLPEARRRRYYVIAHYDSRASDVMDAVDDAPGANDDGSGTALVMELARVFARRPAESTLVFLLTAGEEQGLYGARLHAAEAKKQGLDVRAVLNNDIVGDPSLPGAPGKEARDVVRVFSEGLPREADPETYRRLRSLGAANDSASRQLARYALDVADALDLPVRPMLVWRADRFLRGGDHTAFSDLGIPAVRFTELEETYERQHQDVREENGIVYGDLPEFVDAGYLADVARLNAAVLLHLANAPSVPADARIVVQGLSNDTTLRWEPSPEPDVAGYEVVWRLTTEPRWTHVRDVGPAREAVLSVNKDHHFFGVRAYDRQGFRSPVAFAGAGRR